MKNFGDYATGSHNTYGFIPPKDESELVDREDLVGQDFVITGWREQASDLGYAPSALLGIKFRGAQCSVFLPNLALRQLQDDFADNELFEDGGVAASIEMTTPKKGQRPGYKLVSASEDFAAEDIPF